MLKQKQERSNTTELSNIFMIRIYILIFRKDILMGKRRHKKKELKVSKDQKRGLSNANEI
ncbi:CLUMA_CG012716, isoform A [Clunio marinus]|uniref:CLUMA_CG012716, isoform A n=1 Tax=Clunio marinus TaxID=568069 RepID=A0A1J1IIL1_9DIPT|nr:CLUMA_CG012716, isoform A [Clunio marinus]